MKDVKLGWYLIEKYYRGGSETFALKMTHNIIERFSTWDELFEYVGKNTDGGHEGGYRINAKYNGITKPKTDKTLSFGLVTKKCLIVKKNKGKSS